MDNFSTVKIIKASAGTGKTYRLSLEFIRLILKYGDYINFDEILIITFTNKATAEIRERIFEHLEVLTRGGNGFPDLVQSLKKLDNELSFSDANLSKLKELYEQMITNKGNLRISTIDSFIYSIFSNIIAPHYNIESPIIDNNINQDYLPELFEALFASQNLEKFNRIFTRAYARNLKSYEKFILDLLQNRWQIELGSNESEITQENSELLSEKYLTQYLDKMEESFQIFAQYLQDDEKSFDPDNIFNLKFKVLMNMESNQDDFSEKNFQAYFLKILNNKQFIDKHFSDLLSMGNFWNGSKMLRRKIYNEQKNQLIELAESAKDDLSNFILLSLFKQEQIEILAIAEVIYNAYDKIKFRDCIFTYDDISYYTYRFLYDPEISLFESTSVLNIFYEFLSYNIRFMLIDEFQDTSVIQWSILQPIISDIISGDGIKSYGGTIIVGDEKQSIYGWRGGERDLLLKAGWLLNRREEPENLNRCFRYSSFLAKRINSLFSNNNLHGFLAEAGINWDYTEIEANDTSDNGYFDFSLTNIATIDGDNREYFEQIVVSDLLPLIQSGKINPSETAILARRNKDITLIAEVLAKYDIPYLMESSNSVFQHQAIKPILYLLRYLVIDDIYDLLRFLRSDIILFSAPELKEIIKLYQTADNRELFYQSLSDNSVIATIYKINQAMSLVNLTALLRMIIEEFQIHKIYSSELDLRNISYFLEISANYFLDNIDISASAEGFLDFIEKILEYSEYNQIGLDQSEVIRLMSVHKSKGLQFETLFFFYDANPRANRDSNDLNLLYSYNDDYRSIAPLMMTFNYGAVLKHGICTDLNKENIKKKIIEELNSLYVAITRVKSNLFIRGFYDLKKGLEALLGDIKPGRNISINRIFTACFASSFTEEIQETEEGFSISAGKHIRKKIKNLIDDDSVVPEKRISIYKNPQVEKSGVLDPIKIEHKINEFESKQKGIVIHEYLSYIKYNSKVELNLASKKIIMKYGTIISKEMIRRYIAEAKGFIDRNMDYFNPDIWDTIYNEFVVFDESGNEKRIDRMMINSKLKRVMIVDYKTGVNQQTDMKQLEQYKEIISKLEIIEKENYLIDIKFLENIKQEIT